MVQQVQPLVFISKNKGKIDEIKSFFAEKAGKGGQKFEIYPLYIELPIEEPQTLELKTLLRYKAMEAFRKINRPLIVEHTYLQMKKWDGLPFLDTSLYWDKNIEGKDFEGEDLERSTKDKKIRKKLASLQGEERERARAEYEKKLINFWKNKRFLKLYGQGKKRRVTAVTAYCYTDGKEFYYPEAGSIEGRLVKKLARKKIWDEGAFQWDNIFVPLKLGKNKNEDKLTFAQLGDYKQKISMRRKALENLYEHLQQRTWHQPVYTEAIVQLKKEMRDKNIMLFAGAGLSRNFGLQSYKELIDKIGEKLGYAPDLFNLQGDNDYLWLAEFFVSELTQPQYEAFMKELEKEWEIGYSQIARNKVFEMIVNLRFPLIYTTNFDPLLEQAHEIFHQPNKTYSVIRRVEDLYECEQVDTQIIKYHGDFKNYEDIVFTEKSFFNRFDHTQPLDLKLHADLLKRGVLFVGYSLNDFNLRYLIYKINQLWQGVDLANRPPMFIYLPHPNPVKEKVLRDNHIQPIVGEFVVHSESYRFNYEESLMRLLEKLK